MDEHSKFISTNSLKPVGSVRTPQPICPPMPPKLRISTLPSPTTTAIARRGISSSKTLARLSKYSRRYLPITITHCPSYCRPVSFQSECALTLLLQVVIPLRLRLLLPLLYLLRTLLSRLPFRPRDPDRICHRRLELLCLLPILPLGDFSLRPEGLCP